MPNRIPYALLLTTLIVIGLILVSFISKEIQIGGIQLKKVNILSDIGIKSDSDSVHKALDIASKDTCPPDVNCFYDFSEHGLSHFFKKIDDIKRNKSLVRIAFFGDSFTEGDVTVGDLRDILQFRYGGGGVGFVPVTSEVTGFRLSVIHSFSSNWRKRSVVGSMHKKDNFGISGLVFDSDGSAVVSFKGGNNYENTSRFNRIRFFYGKTEGLDIGYSINDSRRASRRIKGHEPVNSYNIKFDNAATVTYYLGEGADIFGFSLEDTMGIVLDNFALRGMMGTELLSIPAANLKAFQKLLKYDLIIMQYGTNLTTSGLSDFEYYETEMGKVMARFRECFENTPILLISVADRSTRKAGKFVTMDNVFSVLGTQMQIAKKQHLIFWNLFEAMGGENSMPNWVSHEPRWAQKDYTHLTFDGGRELALRFLKAMDAFKEQSEKRVEIP